LTPMFVDTGCNFRGFNAEIDDFYRTLACDDPLESNSSLAADAISTLYSAYLSAEKRGVEITIQTFWNGVRCVCFFPGDEKQPARAHKIEYWGSIRTKQPFSDS
jgi:hypothetical protein